MPPLSYAPTRTASPTYDYPPTWAKGDPHLVTWKNERGEFHGECDLKLLHTHLQSGKNLTIHIRTKIVDDWSFIATTAVKIGNDILEVHPRNKYFLNGAPNAEMSMIGGYPVSFKDKYFTIHLNRNENIVLKSGKLLAVDIKSPSWENFGESVGLFGDYSTGKKLGRDGVTDIKDWNSFGMEWSVHSRH